MDNTEVKETTPEKPATEEEVQSPVVRYVLIGLVTISLVLLLYYAYDKFISNSSTESMAKGLEQERDDPVVDFNLREAIKHLQTLQQNVLKTLSDVTGI
jgi:hypothetical protein